MRSIGQPRYIYFDYKLKSMSLGLNYPASPEQQIALLKEYSRALQHENASRNQQRKALQSQIQRLTKFQRQVKNNTYIHPAGPVNIKQSPQYIQIHKLYTEIKTKYDALLITNANLNTKISEASYHGSTISYYQQENSKISQKVRNLESKNSILQNQVKRYESEIELARRNQSKQPTIQFSVYQSSLKKIEDQQMLIKHRNQQITKLSMQIAVKEQAIQKMRGDLSNYALKINQMADELQRLDRSQKIRYIQSDESVNFKGQIQKYMSINASLVSQISSLKSQNTLYVERLHDLERRIMILEGTNQSLEVQLRNAIQAKKSISAVHVISNNNEEEQLKEAVYSLRKELNEVKRHNLQIRKEYDDLCIQTYEAAKSPQFNRSRSRSPTTRSPLDQSHHHHHHLHTHDDKGMCRSKIQTRSRNKSPNRSIIHVHSNVSSNIRNGNDDWMTLQRKIQQIKQENEDLKKKLIFEG